MGKRRRKAKRKTHAQPVEEGKKGPKTFVFRKGEVNPAVKQLVRDVRKVMEPNTSAKLKERKKNTVKDFLQVAGQLGVTHFLVFTTTEISTYLRLAKNPRGPTLTFRVTGYSLMKDIVGLQNNPHSPSQEYQTPPLIVLNNFGDDQQMKLMVIMFQTMFPPININTIKLRECRRVVLLSYNKEHNVVEFRHYLIVATPFGVSKAVKRIIQTKIPNLGDFGDVADYVLRESGQTESDIEDGGEGKVILPEDYLGKANKKSQQSAVKLIECGPRMTLKLVKIQEGFFDGEVLYHQYVTKTSEEITRLREEKERQLMEKEERKKKQEMNVKKKKGIVDEDEDEDEDGEEDEEPNEEDFDEDEQNFSRHFSQKSSQGESESEEESDGGEGEEGEDDEEGEGEEEDEEEEGEDEGEEGEDDEGNEESVESGSDDEGPKKHKAGTVRPQKKKK